MSRPAARPDSPARGRVLDGPRIREVLRLLDADELSDAAASLAPLVGRKRPVRGGRATPEAEEVDEVKAWLRAVASDPDAADARFMVERAYYKLRSQLPTAARPTRRSASA
jgi:hypothetical protein